MPNLNNLSDGLEVHPCLVPYIIMEAQTRFMDKSKIERWICSSVRYIVRASFYSDMVEYLLGLREVMGSILNRDKGDSIFSPDSQL